jgi:RimJ/RimL family protein N-acetyltransferase
VTGEEPPPAVTVRPAAADDVDALVAMLVEVAGEGRWIGTEAPVDVERRRRRMAADVDAEDAVVLVAEAGGEPVGQLGLHLAPYGVADLGMLVAAGWRGRGVGTALLAEAVRRARQAGAHKIALQVWPHNTAAIALYERFGFQREGYLRRHYRRRSGELWDAVVMGLPLD